jgi:hypothetical protein
MPLTQFYHVRDPMENLLLSVTLRKVGKRGRAAAHIESRSTRY